MEVVELCRRNVLCSKLSKKLSLKQKLCITDIVDEIILDADDILYDTLLDTLEDELFKLCALCICKW